MADHKFTVEGINVLIEESLFHERVYFDGERMSEVSTLRPVFSRVHAFSAGSPPARFEFRTYGVGGWVLIRDGRLLASKRPGWGLAALFGVVGLMKWLQVAFQGDRPDLLLAALFTLGAAVVLAPYLYWERITRQWSQVDRGDDTAAEVR